MRIAVCGLGKVGRPILDFFIERGICAVGYDVDPKKDSVTLEDAVACSDAALFIVQTPSLSSGAFSNAHLEAALWAFHHEAVHQRRLDYLYIVGSTTVPGSCDKFRGIVGDRICYHPEFIRLEHVVADLRAPSFVLIGEGTKAAGDACEALYRRLTSAPVHRMTLIEAELAKITLNCALTMKISLANQLHLVARAVGVDSARIMAAVGTDPRIGDAYLTPGRPYAGPCLPRDNRMFRYFAKKVGVKAWLSAAADRINDDM